MTRDAEERAPGLWDPGAQPERTYQAWTRTTLALAACALLATRLVGSAGAVAIVVSAAGTVAAACLSLIQRRRLRSRRIEPVPRALAALTVLTVLLAAAASGLIVLEWLGAP